MSMRFFNFRDLRWAQNLIEDFKETKPPLYQRNFSSSRHRWQREWVWSGNRNHLLEARRVARDEETSRTVECDAQAAENRRKFLNEP
jgi:hypothetical protein